MEGDNRDIVNACGNDNYYECYVLFIGISRMI